MFSNDICYVFLLFFHFCDSHYHVVVILLSKTKPNYLIFCGFLFCVIPVMFLISVSFMHLVMHKLESPIASCSYINSKVFILTRQWSLKFSKIWKSHGMFSTGTCDYPVRNVNLVIIFGGRLSGQFGYKLLFYLFIYCYLHMCY